MGGGRNGELNIYIQYTCFVPGDEVQGVQVPVPHPLSEPCPALLWTTRGPPPALHGPARLRGIPHPTEVPAPLLVPPVAPGLLLVQLQLIHAILTSGHRDVTPDPALGAAFRSSLSLPRHLTHATANYSKTTGK